MDDLAESAAAGGADTRSAALRRIPRTDLLLADPRLAAAERRLGRPLVKAAVGRAQARARRQEITPEQVADAAVAELPATAATLTPVINATGVIVHTNLGRAPLAPAALERVREVGAAYSNLEYSLEDGVRGSRQAHAAAALRRLTGAEAALVVNNNAGARPGEHVRDPKPVADLD